MHCAVTSSPFVSCPNVLIATPCLNNGQTLTRALSAGIPIEKARGSQTAVYTGAMANDDYKHMILRDMDLIPKYTAIGANLSMLSNRLSWFFDFRGPSLSVDTACSSSLVALDLACQGLRNGDSEMVFMPVGNMSTQQGLMIPVLKGNGMRRESHRGGRAHAVN